MKEQFAKVLTELVEHVEKRKQCDLAVVDGTMMTRYIGEFKMTYRSVDDCTEDDPLCGKCTHMHGYPPSYCACDATYCPYCRKWDPFGWYYDCCSCRSWCAGCRDHIARRHDHVDTCRHSVNNYSTITYRPFWDEK